MPTEVHVTKARIFLVVMNRYKSWIIKKAEHQRIDAFKLWCWRRLLRVPWNARRSNQSSLKEINLEYSLDWCWSSNTLSTWCKDPTHWKRPWGWERLRAGGEGGDRGFDGLTDSMDMNLSNLQETVKYREAWHATVHSIMKSWTWLSDRTVTTICK